MQRYDRALSEAEVVALCELGVERCGIRLDAFLCYKTRVRRAIEVGLADAWGSGQYAGKAGNLVCAPSDTGEGLFDAETHLAAWAITGPKEVPVELEVSSSLGTLRLVASRTSTLRVPTALRLRPTLRPMRWTTPAAAR